MGNTHVAIAIHGLTLLALEKGGPLSASYIAGSINTHPVFLRRVLDPLQEAGLVESQRGANGGIRLLRPPEKITLLAVYAALRANETLLETHPSPNPACPVGGQVNDVLSGHFKCAEDALKSYFRGITVADVLEEVKAATAA